MAVELTRIAVVGAGYMGGGIAQSLAQSGIACTLLDAAPDGARSRHAQVIETAADYLSKGFIDDAQFARLEQNLGWSDDFDETVAAADLVFEVVFERIDVKHEVLRRIEGAAASDAIIATNTSAIPIGELAEALERPERFLGIHWFNPAPLLPGIEVIPHESTDRALLPPIVDMLRAAGKEPAVVSDTPGFVCNRLQFALFREAARMVEDGDASPAEIDTIVRASFGFRLALYGPFAVADMAGLDVYANSYTSLEKALGDRFTVPPSLADRVADGDLGLKSGGGYLGLDADEARDLVSARDNAYVQLSRLRASLVESGGR